MTEGYDELSLERASDLEQLRVDLISKVDPSLRFQIQERGISVIQNTYTGFDSEYELHNLSKHLNNLISVQLAVQGRTLIKVPVYKTMDISYIHPLNSTITTLYKPKLDN